MKNSGYTLVELIIVMAITAIIMAALLFFFSGSMTSYRSQVGHIFATADARNHLQRITDVIRNTQDNTSNDWLQEAGDDAIAIYTDVEGDGALEKVAYRRSTTNIKQLIREVTPAGSSTTTSRVTMSNIANSTSQPLFTYYDASGNIIPVLVNRTSLTVKNIGVTIAVSSQNPQDAGSQTVSTRVTPRSKLRGDVSQIVGPVATREVSIQLPRGNPPASSASTNIVIKNPDSGATISTTTVPFAQLNDGRLSVYANKLYAILNYKIDTGLGNAAGWYVWIAKSVPVISSLFQLPLQSLYTAQCLGVSWATVQASSTSSCALLDTALYPISSAETFQPILAYTENGKRDYVRDISVKPLLPPVASPPGGAYSSAQLVSLSGESGAAIRYTLTGSDPTAASTLYSSSITINSTKTLKAVVIDADGNISSVMTEVYSFPFANGEPAIDLLGHYDQTSFTNPVPVYTKSGSGDGANIFGFGAAAGIAFDTATHRLFVADAGNNRVLVYNLTVTNTLPDRVPDHVLGQVNFYNSFASNGQGRMNVPRGLAYDSTGNRLFVADSFNHRVLVFDVASITNGENAVSVLGQADFIGDNSAVTQTGMNQPRGLAYDSATSRLFVSEYNNNRVTVFDVASITNGENAVSVLGQSSFTVSSFATTQSAMYFPVGLAHSAATNRLFVADYYNNRVTVFDVASITNGENAVSVLGQSSFTTNTVSSTPSQNNIRRPYGIAYDGGNQLFVANGNRVTVYDVASITNGENAVSVLGQSSFTALDSAITQSGMSAPTYVTYNANRLFVSQIGRITIYDVASITNGENAVDALGTYDQTSFTNPAPLYTKNSANDNPNIFGFAGANDVVLDRVNHRLFVLETDNNRVLVYTLNTDNSLPDRIPDNVLGQLTFGTHQGSGIPTTASKLHVPTGMAYDSAGNRLFVADSYNHRVLIFDVASITNGENAVRVLGQANFTSEGLATTQSGMAYPSAVVYDGVNGRLFVSEAHENFSGNNRVTVFDVASITNGEPAVKVLGQSTFTTIATTTTQSGFDKPFGLAYSSTLNYLFVAELLNNRVTVFDVASITNGEPAISVLGQSSFTSNTSGRTQATLYRPVGLAYDDIGGRLFVGDVNNLRVMIYNTATISNGMNAEYVLGAASFTSSGFPFTQSSISAPRGLEIDSVRKVLYVADGDRVPLFRAP